MNALAEAAPGFIWRMPGEGENEDPQITINMTVWDGIEALSAFAYRNLTHRTIMRRRKEWFIDLPSYLALWWLPAGTTPTLQRGQGKAGSHRTARADSRKRSTSRPSSRRPA